VSRPLRADAQRNRDRLLAVAGRAFAEGGGSVALESIAREAGVGIGTLYRHFPTRESLVEEVYVAELDDVMETVPSLLEQHAPDLALRLWMARYARFAATKRGMIEVLRTGSFSGRVSAPVTRERLTAALETLLEAGARAGVLRTDVTADDVTRLMLGISLAASADAPPEQHGRLLDLVVDALRPDQG